MFHFGVAYRLRLAAHLCYNYKYKEHCSRALATGRTSRNATHTTTVTAALWQRFTLRLPAKNFLRTSSMAPTLLLSETLESCTAITHLGRLGKRLEAEPIATSYPELQFTRKETISICMRKLILEITGDLQRGCTFTRCLMGPGGTRGRVG